MWPNKRKSLNKGMFALMTAVLACGLVLSGCGKKTEDPAAAPPPAGTTTKDPNEVLVTYKDGGKVTRGEFDKFIGVITLFQQQYAQFKDDPSFQRAMMDQYLTMKILAARADDAAKAEADKEATAQLEQIKMMMNAQEGGADKLLQSAGVAQADLDQFVKLNIQAIVSQESKVSEQDIQAAYKTRLDQDKDAYTVATVDHILVGTQDPATGSASRTKEEALKRAQEVKGKLTAGGDFTALAKEYSDDPGSKDNGGQYKDAEISQWVPEFKKAAAELPINQISDPVETTYGYHVMKVEARKTKTYDEVKPELKSEAAQTKLADFSTKELPTLIEKNNLPEPTPPPATTPTAPPADAPKTDTGATK